AEEEGVDPPVRVGAEHTGGRGRGHRRGGGRGPEGSRAHPSVLEGSPGMIRARVVTWPAPSGGDADGIYGVRVAGLSAEGAQELARASHALGLWVRWHDGDPILQGPAPLFARLT